VKNLTEKKISPYTRLAIQTYGKIARLQRKIEQLEVELRGWLSKVPDGELDYYSEKTEEIQSKEDEKLANFMRRVGKQPWEK